MSRIIVTGGADGLGFEIAYALFNQGHKVHVFDKHLGDDVRAPNFDRLKAEDPNADDIDVLINCAGVNRINWLQDVTEDDWNEMIGVNALGILKMTQALIHSLARNKGTVVNIVSNAAHMPMRCSAAYNASKGAALILTKQLARELIQHDITVFSVSPNKLKGTAMSESIDEQVVRTRGWTKEQAVEYQLKGLLTGEETPPKLVAEFIAFLLMNKNNHKYLAGCDIPYGL
jgi:NAD(P)-dependent dehydrogenase (short-subunit alcohol dehydrogenase family)